MPLPSRNADTMSDAIAMASSDGNMSKRARKAAQDRLSAALFGPDGMPGPTCPQPTRAEALRVQAARLRDLAARGMKPRAFAKQAAELEREAAVLEAA